ncbi:MAG: antA/AntB antirepressor family protein [Magnetococcales bacterium]|nr:antA/AntB antirepressor family protein [Magnetococcales bacterium]
MNDLLAISMTRIGGESIQTVNARDLHAFLDVGKVFGAWVTDRIEQGGFAEQIDYVVCFPNLESETSRGGQNKKDYFLSLDTAKHLAMMERNEKGKQARQYFVDCEKRLKAMPAVTSMVTTDPGLVADLTIARFVADSLRISEAGQIAMYGRIAKIHGRLSAFLPAYTDEQITKSLTELLKEHRAGISAVKANTILMDLGILEELSRSGAKGVVHKFKALTEAGQKYGKNLISPQNERETQPHYFADTFPDLLDRINNWLQEAA